MAWELHMTRRMEHCWSCFFKGRIGYSFHWWFVGGFDRHKATALVKEVCECPSLRDFYQSFPWLHEGHPFYEVGRLYPSLIHVTESGSKVFLSNFGVASDPQTYHAMKISFVVNCSRDLPFVDEVLTTLRSQKAEANMRPTLWLQLVWLENYQTCLFIIINHFHK